jgi:hypothetical protein
VLIPGLSDAGNIRVPKFVLRQRTIREFGVHEIPATGHLLKQFAKPPLEILVFPDGECHKDRLSVAKLINTAGPIGNAVKFFHRKQVRDASSTHNSSIRAAIPIRPHRMPSAGGDSRARLFFSTTCVDNSGDLHV